MALPLLITICLRCNSATKIYLYLFHSSSKRIPASWNAITVEHLMNFQHTSAHRHITGTVTVDYIPRGKHLTLHFFLPLFDFVLFLLVPQRHFFSWTEQLATPSVSNKVQCLYRTLFLLGIEPHNFSLDGQMQLCPYSSSDWGEFKCRVGCDHSSLLGFCSQWGSNYVVWHFG